MILSFYLAAILLFAILGAVAATGKLSSVAARVGLTTAALAAIFSAVSCLASGEKFIHEFPGLLPFGKIVVCFDAFSAWFALPTVIVAAFGAYFRAPYQSRLSRNFAAYPWLTAAMLSLLLAGDAISFLLAWEFMSLSAWWLLLTSPLAAPRRLPSWFYLIFSEISALALIVAFLFISQNADGSFVFADWRLADGLTHLTHRHTTWIFVAVLLGFGCKAGFFGVHLWMPETYGSIRGADAALLSAAMSKISFYGLWKILSAFPPSAIPYWTAIALIIIGMATALWGIISALTAERLRRIAAYSSMENMGLIAAMSGFALLGLTTNADWKGIAMLAWMFHVWHHSLAKMLVFHAVEKAANISDRLDDLGGLQKIMPRAGLVLAIGVGALAALPFTGGFVPELLLAVSAIKSLAIDAGWLTVISSLGMLAFLGLVGGLAVFAMFRFYAVIFLGSPRSEKAKKIIAENLLQQNADNCRTLDLGGLAVCGAGAIVALGFVWAAIVPAADAAIAEIFPFSADAIDTTAATEILLKVAQFLLIIGALGGLFYYLRRRHAANDTVGETWNCGYSAPNAKIQYTGSSLAEPLRVVGKGWLRPRIFSYRTLAYFPRALVYSTKIRDLALSHFYAPVYRRLTALFGRVRAIQHGRVHLYIFYIMAALAGGLIWALALDN